MQTFLCEPFFDKVAQSLDYKRLGKQRVEAYQILLALGNDWAWSVYTGNKTRENYGWQNHPAVLMWRNYDTMLLVYYSEIVNEWVKRGYNNNMALPDKAYMKPRNIPVWFHNADYYKHKEMANLEQKIIISHRCRLLQKDLDFYSNSDHSHWFNDEKYPLPENWYEVDYYWPVTNENS